MDENTPALKLFDVIVVGRGVLLALSIFLQMRYRKAGTGEEQKVS